MGPTNSMATWTTASIHITATAVHFRSMETGPSITFTETRCVMDAATQATEVIARNSVKLKEHGCRPSWVSRRVPTARHSEILLSGGLENGMGKQEEGDLCR